MKFLKTFAMCAAAVSFAFADEAPTGAPVAPASEDSRKN